MKTNRFTLIALSVILATAVMGCGTFTVQPTSTPTNTATPTSVPFTPGDYVGTNPDITITIDAFGNLQIQMNVCNIDYWSVIDGLTDGWPQPILKSDNSFIYGSKSLYQRELSGKVEGTVIHGQYYWSCGDSGPLTGSWTASYVAPGSTPTSTPTIVPITPQPTATLFKFPIKLGEYSGDGIRFNVIIMYGNYLVSGLSLQAGACSFTQTQLDMIHDSGHDSGIFLLHGEDFDISVGGEISEGSAKGTYSWVTPGAGHASCMGSWTANWVSPY